MAKSSSKRKSHTSASELENKNFKGTSVAENKRVSALGKHMERAKSRKKKK